MVYSILYISSPTRSSMAPLIGCRLSSIIKASYQRSFCMAGPKKLVLANIEGLTLLLGRLTNHFQPVFPEGHCRVHCSVRDRSVQCIPNHLYPAFGSFHSQIPKSVEYFFSMMRSEHHTGMHSFHNILISKSALVSLNNCKEKFTFFPKQNKSKQQKNAFCYTFNVRTIISTKLMKEHTESTVRRGHGDAPHFG